MLYLMADILTDTNIIQTILPASTLKFLEIPAAVSKLVEDKEQKAIDPTKPTTCYLAKLDGFIEVSKLSAGARFHLQNQNNFTIESFVNKAATPLIKDLISEVKAAFQTPECLVGVTYFDLQRLPSETTKISSFRVKETDGLVNFFIQKKRSFSIHLLIKIPC